VHRNDALFRYLRTFSRVVGLIWALKKFALNRAGFISCSFGPLKKMTADKLVAREGA
jgi:hypothetical protein